MLRLSYNAILLRFYSVHLSVLKFSTKSVMFVPYCRVGFLFLILSFYLSDSIRCCRSKNRSKILIQQNYMVRHITASSWKADDIRFTLLIIMNAFRIFAYVIDRKIKPKVYTNNIGERLSCYFVTVIFCPSVCIFSFP